MDLLKIIAKVVAIVPAYFFIRYCKILIDTIRISKVFRNWIKRIVIIIAVLGILAFFLGIFILLVTW